ncbi:MAG: 50S ribosomal protein L3 [Chloroflexi bacterium]|nr:50S ribosomal protein L3 [Chloroflexota bacterium]
MIRGILGRKLGMTRLFDERGVATATTIIEAGPCWVTQTQTNERKSGPAVQLGYGETKPSRLTKGQRGHLKDLPPLRHLREVPVDSTDDVAVGERVDVGIFSEGEVVDVTGTSKGRGFQGVVRRHHFGGGPKTHGQSDRWRAPGSIGSGTTPGRVMKGVRMAGQMGNERVTVKNLRVLRVDAEKNLLAVQGAVPGPNGGLVILRKAARV